MLVQEVMTKNIVKIDSNRTIFEACEEYSRNRVGSLVVMNNDIIVGIVTERDIIEKVILNNKNPNKIKVLEIMSKDIKTIHALAPLEKAAKIMNEHQIKKLPVILNNEIVGIITETDLTQTVEVFSDAIEELTQFYAASRENLDTMMDKWEDLIVTLRNYRKFADIKDAESLMNEIK